MVVDVLPVRVRCHYKGVLALGKAHGQFVAHLVSLLCGDFPRTEGLPYLISDYITLLPASVYEIILPLGKHKFFIYSQGAAFITAYKLPLLRFIRVLCIVGAAFQASRNRLSLVFMQRNQPCCCHLKPPP